MSDNRRRPPRTRSLRTATALLIAAAILVAGCGNRDGNQLTDAGSQSQSVEPGTVSGIVRLNGQIPAWDGDPCDEGHGADDESVMATHDHAACADYRSLVVGDDGGVGNVVVSIENVPTDNAGEGSPVVLDQVDLEFVPHVVALAVGDTLTARNSDGELHNVHVALGPITLFNEAMPAFREEITHTFLEPGAYRVVCDVHPHMRAWIYVYPADTVVAISGVDGTFSLPNIPPGAHTVSIWHERSGSSQIRVEVSAGVTTQLDVSLDISGTVAAEEHDHSAHEHDE